MGDDEARFFVNEVRESVPSFYLFSTYFAGLLCSRGFGARFFVC